MEPSPAAACGYARAVPTTSRYARLPTATAAPAERSTWEPSPRAMTAGRPWRSYDAAVNYVVKANFDEELTRGHMKRESRRVILPCRLTSAIKFDRPIGRPRLETKMNCLGRFAKLED
jgi:hypothetical protein